MTIIPGKYVAEAGDRPLVSVQRNAAMPLPRRYGIVAIVDCVKAHPSPWCAGKFGFVLENARPIKPFPVKGALVFFPVEYQP